MSRLFSSTTTEPDIRPSFFAMASLMMILLPTLLLITNPQKMVGIPISVAGSSQDVPPEPIGIIEKIVITVSASSFELKAIVQKTDVLASSGNSEQKTWQLQSWSALMVELKQLKKLDPNRTQIQIIPAPDSSTQEIISWMDQLQQPDFFPEVILGESQ